MKPASLRIASLLLALCLIFVLLPVPQAKAAGLSLGQLQAKFPAGAYWNHVAGHDHGYGGYGHCGGSCNNPDGYTWSPCYSHSQNVSAGYYDCNVFDGGLQCCGFARKLAYDAYGSYSTGWTSYYDGDANNYMWSSLKPGDVLHYGGGNADPTHGHWVFVIGVSGNAITVGECNIYNGPCQIRWGNVIYKDNISAKLVCVAPYALDSGSSQPASPITWTNCLATPTQTDAKLEIRANAPYNGDFGEVGITVWDADGNVVAQKTEAADSRATNYLNIWYYLTEETGAVLKPNHNYTFQFHVYFNGTCYTSDIGAFTTQPCSAHSWDSGKVTTKPTMTKEGEKTFTCTACSETRTEPIPATGVCDGGSECVMTPYRDLSSSEWYHDGIHYCIEKSLMNGMSSTAFEPSGMTTRAQLVTILYRAAGSPDVSALSEPFKDVAKEDWFRNAIVWAYHNKVVTGVSADSFAPNANVTREQVATILHRYRNAPTGKGSLSGFPDASSISGYAIDAMVWAVGEGLINGIKNGNTSTLAPTGNATRAQIATILMRYIK